MFGNEPILEVTAALPEAQIVETYLLSAIHHQTMAASAAYRLAVAAKGTPVVDFGTRHAQGAAAGVDTARAAYIAGMAATSNVAAGRRFGVPLSGTMAHSYIQAHERESDALASFAATHRGTTLLVDTYDVRGGVQRVIDLAAQSGDSFDVAAIRIDSGDLGANARMARAMLDAAGLTSVRITVSGELDAAKISDLLAAGAPIDGYGVGTALAVSTDAPYLDTAYKLAAYAGQGRMKLAASKRTWPGRKQVFRQIENGVAVRDVLAAAHESGGSASTNRSWWAGGGSTKRGPRSTRFASTPRGRWRNCRNRCAAWRRPRRRIRWRSATGCATPPTRWRDGWRQGTRRRGRLRPRQARADGLPTRGQGSADRRPRRRRFGAG